MAYGRKITGGKYRIFSKKRKYEIQRTAVKTKLGKTKQKIIRGLGGNKRSILLSEEYANVVDAETNKTKKVKIKNVIETHADRFLARQNILVKSAIIETELGKAKITNHPGQEGMIQAVLLKE